MAAKLDRAEAYAFLDSRPGWISMTTIGRDGYPHTVPVGYFRLDDKIVLGGPAHSQRFRNIERNPRVSLMVERGRKREELIGLMLQGDATLHTRPEEVLHFMRAGAERRGVPEEQLPTEAFAGAAYVSVEIRRMISWDYAKDAEPPST